MPSTVVFSVSLPSTTAHPLHPLSSSSHTDVYILLLTLQAIEGLTKLDVAEIRTMSNPPAAVEVVLEAVMLLLTGEYHSTK